MRTLKIEHLVDKTIAFMKNHSVPFAFVHAGAELNVRNLNISLYKRVVIHIRGEIPAELHKSNLFLSQSAYRREARRSWRNEEEAGHDHHD